MMCEFVSSDAFENSYSKKYCVMRLLLTLEFLSCQFDIFFPVFRAEIIARFVFRSFSSLNFVMGGSYMVCDHRCVTAHQRFLWILWHLLPGLFYGCL